MSQEFFENSVDIESIYEVFTTAEQTANGVTDSKFTDSENLFKTGGVGLKTAYSQTIPTSAGDEYLGGAHLSTYYQANRVFIDAALKGCRPIGIFLATLSSGTYYLNRINGETWLSTTPNANSGTHLSHDPKYVHLELQAGGGGGAGSNIVNYNGGGGGAGGLVYYACALVENSYIKLVVGGGGSRGENQSDAGDGGSSYVQNVNSVILASATGGGGGKYHSTGGTGGSGSGTVVLSGGSGGNYNEQKGAATAVATITISKPEANNIWSYAAYAGGSSGKYNGGGGGASHFAKGASSTDGKPDEVGTLGSGGAGSGGWGAKPGSAGGDGFIKVYY